MTWKTTNLNHSRLSMLQLASMDLYVYPSNSSVQEVNHANQIDCGISRSVDNIVDSEIRRHHHCSPSRVKGTSVYFGRG